jgi:hypothetical protein
MRALQDTRRSYRVPTGCVRDGDAELGEALPQVLLLGRAMLPLGLEDLVRGKRATLVDESTC